MKLRSRLIIGFLIMAMIIAVGNIYSIFTNQSSLDELITTSMVSSTNVMMSKIDEYFYHKIQEFKIFSKEKTFQDALLSSNADFEKLNNIDEFIGQRDKEWVSHTSNTLPFMNDIIYNSISDKLRNKISYYEDVFDTLVVSEIFITNAYGANIAQSGLTTDYRQDDETWWQMAKRDGNYVQDLEFDESANVFSVNMGIRIDDENENFLGVMKVVLNINEVTAIIQDEHQSSSGQTKYTLFDGTGKVVYSTERLETFEDMSKNPFYQRLVGDSGYFTSNSISENAGPHNYAYSLSNGYNSFGGLGWILVTGHDQDLLAPLYVWRETLVLVTIISLIIALFIGVYLSNKISGPTAELKEGAQKIAEGNYDVIITPRGGDELKVLCESFNHMSKQIKNQIYKLKKIDTYKEVSKLKDEFASMITHELKTPLTPIQGYCEMLKEPEMLGKLNSAQLNAVDEIQKNAKQLERLIADVLDAQKLDMKKVKYNYNKFQVDEYMTGIYDMYLPYMKEKNIEFVNTTSTNLTLKSDPHRLEQALGNLIKNAVDFVKVNGRIEIGATNEGPKIIFYVIDNGIGMSQEHQQHLFKRFYQVDTSLIRKHGGTGLGLSISLGIVRGLGGKIRFESQLGIGTRFYISIPIEVEVTVEDNR